MPTTSLIIYVYIYTDARINKHTQAYMYTFSENSFYFLALQFLLQFFSTRQPMYDLSIPFT